MPDWLVNIATSTLSRVIQDLLTGLAASLVADGVITKSQQDDLVGSLFFIAMLIVNYILHRLHQNASFNKGVDQATAAILTPQPVQSVKGPQ